MKETATQQLLISVSSKAILFFIVGCHRNLVKA